MMDKLHLDRCWALMAVTVVFGGPATAVAQAPRDAGSALAGPLAPTETLRHFRLPPGLAIELVAVEPQVIDPVEIRFDAAGRLWVAEMRDYPYGPAAGEKPRSRIRVLEDRDQDGRFETAVVFADELLFVTGLQPWRDGVFVTMAGQVAYLKDGDGDGKADQREVWYTGFAEENSQLRANHPRLGLDNRLYVANGLRGGTVVDARRPERSPLPISNLDFRFDPRTGEAEAVTGVGQFGLTFDDFGNRFVCSNRNPLMHIVLEDRFLKRNPLAAVSDVRADVAQAGEASQLFPLSRAWTTSNLHAHQFTAACGALIYRGHGLPERYYGAGFTCDPTANLVHAEILSPEGATFTARPEREGVEFLATPDEWFRPVNLELGPDGALYVVDMYRAVIEHPDFMPTELKQRPDLLLGTDRGRIYRIVAEGARRTAGTPPAALSSAELVEQLEHPNAWQRDTAARLLLEQDDAAVTPKLQEQLLRGQSLPGRIRALWLLDARDGLTDELLSASFAAADARIREQAVWVCEDRLEQESWRKRVLDCLDDEDPRVRFAALLVASPVEAEQAVPGLAAAARRGAGDVWTRRALAIACKDLSAAVALQVVRAIEAEQRAPAAGELSVLEELIAVAGAAPEQAPLQPLLEFLLRPAQEPAAKAMQRDGLRVLAQALSRRGKHLSILVQQASQPEMTLRLQQVLQDAAARAADGQQTDAERIAALELVAGEPQAQDWLPPLALDEPSQAVRLRALQALSRTADVEPWRKLLTRFPGETPTIRRAILDGVLARTDRTSLLLDEIQAGRIKSSELDRTYPPRLLKHGDPAIRARAAPLLADAIPADRQKVLAEYQAALRMKADPRRGQQVFAKNCATCHRIGEVGVNVAPDISDSRTKTAEQILADVLQPNRAIDNNYVSYVVATSDGQALTGILTTETATSVTLKQAEGKTLTLLRSQIEELRSTGVSLMPEGLEKNIPLQDMADLVSFVKNWRYLDGLTPVPELSQADVPKE